VPRFLSPDWVDAFNAAAATVTVPEPGADAPLAAADGTFAVCQVVRGGPDGDVAVTVHVADGRVWMTPGADDAAQVTVALQWDDAVAMAQGTLAVADALTAGRIRVRGDLGVLVAGQAALAAVQPALASLHAATTT
jgi:hypothetical protein